jgi:hypothetical protein
MDIFCRSIFMGKKRLKTPYYGPTQHTIQQTISGRVIACRIRLDGPAGSQPFEKVAKHGKKGSINTI